MTCPHRAATSCHILNASHQYECHGMNNPDTLNDESRRISDRPAPSHLPDSDARTGLHATPFPDQRGLNFYSYDEPYDPRTELLDSISDRVHQIITSVESLFREAQNRPAKKNAQTQRLNRVSAMVETLQNHRNSARADIDFYLSVCSSLGDRPVEWIQG